MSSRLSQLLERIRPAGVPGAPGESAPQRDQAAAEEIAELARVLSRFDAEVNEVLETARDHAARLLIDAERRAEQIRVDIPDRLAAAESLVFAPVDGRDDAEAVAVAAESRREIGRVRQRAEPRMAELVDDAVAVIWRLLPMSGSAGETT